MLEDEAADVGEAVGEDAPGELGFGGVAAAEADGDAVLADAKEAGAGAEVEDVA